MNKSEQGFPPQVESWDSTVARAMEQARQRAQKAQEENLAKSEFLAELSHELRTPLNGLLGMVDLMLNTDDLSQRKNYADFAHRCGDMLQDLIDAILDFSQLETGDIPKTTKAFAPYKLFEEIERLMFAQASDKELWLKFQLDPAVPEELWGDEARIRQVLINLVSNSIKFTSKGHISVNMTIQEKSPDSVRVKFSVSDTGHGVPKEIQQRIFLPYFRGDPFRKDGTGLGLSICKQIVERLDGEIDLESKPGMGSTFWFEIPLEVRKRP